MRTESAKTRRSNAIGTSSMPRATAGPCRVEIAHVLRGKHRPQFTPHVDTGDFVIVLNAAKVKLTGAKLDKKFYYHHSGFPGGFKAESYRPPHERKPELPIEKAVKGMLPKNVLGRQMLSKLKVYAGADHPHAAQKPQTPRILSATSNEHTQTISTRTTPPASARPPSPASASPPAAARSPSTSRPADDYFERETSAWSCASRSSSSRSTTSTTSGRRWSAAATARRPRPCATASLARSARSTPSAARRSSKAGFLTRDARKKERKKYGQPGARKRFQYTKR